MLKNCLQIVNTLLLCVHKNYFCLHIFITIYVTISRTFSSAVYRHISISVCIHWYIFVCRHLCITINVHFNENIRHLRKSLCRYLRTYVFRHLIHKPCRHYNSVACTHLSTSVQRLVRSFVCLQSFWGCRHFTLTVSRFLSRQFSSSVEMFESIFLHTFGFICSKIFKCISKIKE